MQKLMWINKPLGVGVGGMTALRCESETHLHPTLSQSSEGKGFQRQPRAAQHSWSPCYTPPSPQLPRPRRTGRDSVGAFCLDSDLGHMHRLGRACVFCLYPLAVRVTSWLGEGLSTLP